MSKLIIIAGIKRSGSTWMYNAVRLCLEHAGYSVHIAGDGQYYQEDCKADYQIIKTHPFVQWMANKADYVFTSDRDDKGIRDSWKRFKGEEVPESTFKKWRYWFSEWRKLTIFEAYYFDIKKPEGRREIVENIYRILVMRPITKGICNELNAIKPPTDKDYDPVTLMFSNHITSG